MTLDLARMAIHGLQVAHSKNDRNGNELHLIVTSNGDSVAMSESDVSEVMDGTTTVYEVIQRNRAAQMETPWPTAKRPLGTSSE